MRFVLDSHQKDFYMQKGFLTLSGLFKEHSLLEVKKVINEDFEHYLKTNYQPDFLSCYEQGRDLWRKYPALQALLSHSRLTGVLASLFEQRPLRLAFDQILISSHWKKREGYFDGLTPYTEHFSVQGLVGGLLICLETLAHPLDELPSHFGETLVFSPRYPLPTSLLEKIEQFSFLTVGYSQVNALYKPSTHDPLKHLLKSFEYEEGDLLKDSTHPVVFV